MKKQNEERQCSDILRKKNFSLVKMLGFGAFGTVYLAEHNSQNRQKISKYAIKCISKIKLAKKPMLWTYLKQQIEIQININHPNVVRLYQYFQAEGWVFMIMEYCNMGNILNHPNLKQNKCYVYKQAKKIMAGFLDGLNHLHSNKIIHRDLKIENVLLMQNPKNKKQVIPKICDFGFAKQIQTSAETVCGTTYYMAPQIYEKKQYDGFVDIWAAGVIFFYMLYTVYPFKSMNMVLQIKNKCQNGFKMESVRGMANNSSISQQDEQNLSNLFLNIFRINPTQRISLSKFTQFMKTDINTIQRVLSPNKQKQYGNRQIQAILQKIAFLQSVLQEVKQLKFLTKIQQLAFKYYIEKYCLTIILMNGELCLRNNELDRIKTQLQRDQSFEAVQLANNLHKIQINKFDQCFSTICSQNFSDYKQPYRILINHIYQTARQKITDAKLNNRIKLKIYCCHSFNRIFEDNRAILIFKHFFRWRQQTTKNSSTDFKIKQISSWIDGEKDQNIVDTIKIINGVIYSK